MSPDVCPTCGADVPSGARVCPECGADEETGWSENAKYEALGIPTDDFDYNKFVENEFSSGNRDRQGPRSIVRIGTILLLILFVPGALYLVIYLLGAVFNR